MIRSQRARAALLVALSGIFMLALFSITSIARDNAQRHAHPSLKFSGALRTASDLLWVKVAGRVAFQSRVTSKEAEENFRIIRAAVRLNPEAREPYEYGAIGLMLWNRTDLAVLLTREGLRRFPQDEAIERTLLNILLLSGDTLDTSAFLNILQEPVDLETDSAVRSPGKRGRMEEVSRAPEMAQERPTNMTLEGADRRHGVSTPTAVRVLQRPAARMMMLLQARKLEQWGLLQDAIAIWRRVETIAREAEDEDEADQAKRQIERLSENKNGKYGADTTEVRAVGVQ